MDSRARPAEQKVSAAATHAENARGSEWDVVVVSPSSWPTVVGDGVGVVVGGITGGWGQHVP
jgi:hypothetical protein